MSAVPTRSDLGTLPVYVPGRTVEGAIKLASNEVPGGPLPSVAKAIVEAAANVNRYPDSGCNALSSRIATEVDFPVSQIAIGCGSVSLCQQLAQAVCEPGDEVLYAWRSFEAYPTVTQVANARSIKVPLTAGHEHDLDAMLAAITPRTKIVYVCNPNNPTGTAVRREALERFLDAVPSTVLVVLDEAYREFVTDSEVPDGLEYVRSRDNVAVLRTFSKAYGLAGLRVGYAVAPENIAKALRQVFVAFSVNMIAQAAAIASLDASDELMARVKEIVGERERVRRELIDAGYDVPDTQANFVWLPLGEETPKFAEFALDHKLVLRPYATDGVRVTISTPEENDLFLAAARAYKG
ncbi:histidinol-phosphate transaminase [Amycolatopsis sp. NPDC059657]|uniref:histidinol-phosphate transaminase n=1 Tax=Amycolatopsis sp. NPDC059657 TaxID=3346899 RepID=UPI00366B1FB6